MWFVEGGEGMVGVQRIQQSRFTHINSLIVAETHE